MPEVVAASALERDLSPFTDQEGRKFANYSRTLAGIHIFHTTTKMKQNPVYISL